MGTGKWIAHQREPARAPSCSRRYENECSP